MSWIVLLKTGKCLPGSFSQRLVTISTADECVETILRFINDHAPGARELVFSFLFFPPFFLQKLLLLLNPLYFKSNISLLGLFFFIYSKFLISFHGSLLRGGGSDGGGQLQWTSLLRRDLRGLLLIHLLPFLTHIMSLTPLLLPLQ